jgi:hypothetical protein
MARPAPVIALFLLLAIGVLIYGISARRDGPP